MKRKILCFLIMSLLILNTTPVFASSNTGQTTITLENIKEIMLDNSIEMQKAENNLQKVYDEEDDLDDEIDDLESEIESLNDKIKSLDPESESYERDYQKYKSELSTTKSSLSTKKNEKELYKYTLKKARIEYYTTVQSKIYEAQKAYIEYLNTLATIELNKDESSANEKQLEIYKKQYEYGFISKNEYDNYIIENSKNTNNYDEQEKTAKQALNDLYFKLGLDADSNVTFDTDIQSIFEEIAKIDYEEDLNEMLDNNYDIKSQEIAIDELDDSDDSNDYDVDNAELELEATKTNAELSFKKSYDELITLYTKLSTSYKELNKSQTDYVLKKEKYSSGFVSLNDLEKDKRTLDAAEATFINDRNTLYLTYLNYLQMKEGY